MPVTLTGVASAIASRAAPTASAPASADFPDDNSNNQPDQALLNLVASLLSHGALLDVANAFTAQQTYAQAAAGTPTEVVTGTVPTSSSASARFLVKQWDGSAGKVRLYFVYLSANRMALEVTVNAAWSNGSSNWTSDVGGATGAYAVRWRLNQADGVASKFPGIDTDLKAVTSAGQVWTETAFSWGGDALTAAALSASGGTVTVIDGRRLASGEVCLNLAFVASGSISANTTLFTLPAGWRPSANIKQPGATAASVAGVWNVPTTTGQCSWSGALVNTDQVHLNLVYLPAQ